MELQRSPRPYSSHPKSEERTGPRPADIEGWLRELEPHLPRVANEVIHRHGWPMQPADIDDILQEVRFQLWSVDLKKYDASRGKLVPFVVTRIYWEAANHLRARHRAAQFYNDFASQVDEELPQATPEELFAEAEHQKLLDEVVNWAREQLPDPLERDSVLAPVDKRTLVEVAKQHSTDPWRVKQARKEGLDYLRKAAPKQPETLLRRRRKACP